MSPEVAETLQDAFTRYEAALARVGAVRTDADPAALRAVRQARIALCRALELSGWEPPQEVRSQLLHDRTQLAHAGGPVAA